MPGIKRPALWPTIILSLAGVFGVEAARAGESSQQLHNASKPARAEITSVASTSKSSATKKSSGRSSPKKKKKSRKPQGRSRGLAAKALPEKLAPSVTAVPAIPVVADAQKTAPQTESTPKTSSFAALAPEPASFAGGESLGGFDETVAASTQHSDADADFLEEEEAGVVGDVSPMPVSAFPELGPVRYTPSQRERLAEMLVRSTLVSLGLKLPGGGAAPDRALLAAVPTHLPAIGRITSPFGKRQSPFTHRVVVHRGLDIGARSGSPIYAAADGVVTHADWKGPLGRLVTINHGYGLVTRYAHTSSIDVKKGDYVRRGQLIARVGTTGRSTGAHLHFEVRVAGKPVDPRLFLLDASEAIEAEHLTPGSLLASNATVTPIAASGAVLAAAAAHASSSALQRQTPIEETLGATAAVNLAADSAPRTTQLTAAAGSLDQAAASAAAAGQPEALGIGGEAEGLDAPELGRPLMLARYDTLGKLPANLAILGIFMAVCLVAGSYVQGAQSSPLMRRRRRQRREA